MDKLIIPNLECINSVKNYLIGKILYQNDCMHNRIKMRLISLLICHIQYYLLVFPYEKTFGYLYNLVRYESSQNIIKYLQLLTHCIASMMAKNIPSSCHKNQEYFASISIEFVVQMSTRHISFPIGIIPIQSIYQKNSIKFSSNIQKSINIVEYQIWYLRQLCIDNKCYNIFQWTLLNHIDGP